MKNTKFLILLAVTFPVLSLFTACSSKDSAAVQKPAVTKTEVQQKNASVSTKTTIAEAPVINAIAKSSDSVGKYSKLELTVDLKATYDNPYDPDQIDLSSVFTAPSGKEWKVFGFFDGDKWKVRFTPNETGKWSYKVIAANPKGKVESSSDSYTCTDSKDHGWVKVSTVSSRYFSYDDGTSFYGVGMAYPWNVTEQGLDNLKSNGANMFTYWNGNYDSPGIGGGIFQLESVNSGIGKYDQLKGKRIDELVDWCDSRDMKMTFVIWPHDSLAQNIGGSWAKQWLQSAYSLIIDAKDFYTDEKAWEYQKKLYRYIIARWGYSQAIGIWDIVDEIDGTDGWSFGDPKSAEEWSQKVNSYIKENDPYGHPTMGSMSGGGDAYWGEGYKIYDLADREIYFDFDYTTYVTEAQKRWKEFNKPIVTGETGAVENPTLFHNSIWASLSNGLAMTPFWWEYNTSSEQLKGQLKPFSRFVSDIGFDKLTLNPAVISGVDISKAKGGAKKVDFTVALEDSSVSPTWMQESWADANKDENGKKYTPALSDKGGPKGAKALEASFRFNAGVYSQGMVRQNFGNWKKVGDWSKTKSFSVDIYLDEGVKYAVDAKAVIFPSGNWVEANDSNKITLEPGKWVTLTVPITANMDSYWQNALPAEGMKIIKGFAVKVFSTSGDGKPLKIRFANPRLLTDKSPEVILKGSDAWAMKSDKMTFGWMISSNANITGKKIAIDDTRDGAYKIQWYDCWTGKTVSEVKTSAVDGELVLTAPKLDKKDIAFKIIPVN